MWVDRTSYCRFFLSLAEVTLQSRKDLPTTSTDRKRCSAVVDDGDQRIAVSISGYRSRDPNYAMVSSNSTLKPLSSASTPAYH